jgi:hypothetical protein
MAVFNKSDLTYADYKWEAKLDDDDPKLTGKPDSTMLNRTEGYEMLYFINRYMENKGWKQAATGEKIEKYLRTSSHSGKPHAFWIKELNDNFKL